MLEYLAYSLCGVLLLMVAILLLNRYIILGKKISRAHALILGVLYALVGEVGFWCAVFLLFVVVLVIIFKKSISGWWDEPL